MLVNIVETKCTGLNRFGGWYLVFVFFFFKQKTAYEIKECDWSSDVCSSDLETALTRVESVLNELTDQDLSSAMDNFFNALEDVAQNSDNSSIREAFIGQAKFMTDFFASTATDRKSVV